MPAYAVARLAERLGDLDGLTIAILGLAYRGGVKEAAFSGAYALADALADAGAHPVVHDPMYNDEELTSNGLTPTTSASTATPHHPSRPPEYHTLRSTDLGGAPSSSTADDASAARPTSTSSPSAEAPDDRRDSRAARGANVFITGGAGFIGSTLASRLVDDNQITIYDNFARDALSATSLASHPNVRVVRGDILDLQQLDRRR